MHNHLLHRTRKQRESGEQHVRHQSTLKRQKNPMSSLNITTPIVSCPKCHSGSSDMLEDIQQAGIWGMVTCHACNEEYEIATAIDEMFVSTANSGYSLWTGGKQIYRPVTLTTGQTHLINIRGIFDKIYLITPLLERIEWLAGGYDTKHIIQGYVMISIAPNPDGKITTLNGGVLIEG